MPELIIDDEEHLTDARARAALIEVIEKLEAEEKEDE